MKLVLAIAVWLLIAPVLFVPVALAQRVPTAYLFEPGETFAYRINGRVTLDDHIFTYGGFVQYSVAAVGAESVELDFNSDVRFNDYPYVATDPVERVEQIKAQSRAKFNSMMSIEKGRRDRDYVFPGLGQANGRFTLAFNGTVTDGAVTDDQAAGAQDVAAALPFYFGDLRRVIFQPLPPDGRPTWQSSGPLITGSKKEPAKDRKSAGAAEAAFVNLFEVTQYDRFDLRPAREKSEYRVLVAPRGRRDTSIKVGKQSQIESFAVNLPFDGDVRAEWMIDAQTARPASYQQIAQFRINRDGTMLVAQANWKMESMTAAEVDAWMEAEDRKAEMAGQARQDIRDRADAREQERLAKESRRRPTRIELAAALEGLASDSPTERRKAVTFLAEHPLAARDRRVKKAVLEFAAEDDFFTRTEMQMLTETWNLTPAP